MKGKKIHKSIGAFVGVYNDFFYSFNNRLRRY